MKKKNLFKNLITIVIILSIFGNVFADDVAPVSLEEQYGPATPKTNIADIKNYETETAIPANVYSVSPAAMSSIQQIQVQDAGIGIGPYGSNENNQIVSESIMQKTNEMGLPNFDEFKSTAKLANISAPAYVLINATTGHVYAKKDADTKYDPAGLANLMTAYIAVSKFPMTENLSVTDTAVRGIDRDAAIAGLTNGDTITLKDAIGSMFVKGCVDSANVIAEAVSGSKDSFVTLMNETAKTLGLTNTTFVNPSGLSNNNQLSSALDMAKLMSKVCENNDLVELMKLTVYKLPAARKRKALILYGKNTQLTTGSSSYNPDVTCSRMGYNKKAMYCVASLMQVQGCDIIAVVLKAQGTQFGDTKKLFEYAKTACTEDLQKNPLPAKKDTTTSGNSNVNTYGPVIINSTTNGETVAPTSPTNNSSDATNANIVLPSLN